MKIIKSFTAAAENALFLEKNKFAKKCATDGKLIFERLRHF